MPDLSTPSQRVGSAALLSRRTLLTGLAVAAVAPLHAQQAAYPNKPIRFVVPYVAGGTADLVARTIGQKVSERLGTPVIIDNRSGAGGNVGMDLVAKAAPDGYTIGYGAISTNAMNPHLYKSMPFDPRKDFAAISLLGTSTIVLAAGPALPVRTVAELIDHARKNPGLSYATAGAGTSMHMAAALFEQLTKLTLTHVAYKGSVPAIADVLGGHVPIIFDNLPASLPHIQSGRIRALAVAGSHRSASLPNVPTLAEAGLANYAVEPWFGVYAPAGSPAAIIKKLNEAFTEAIASSDVRDRLTQAGFAPRSSTPSDLEILTLSEYERLGKLARNARMSAD
jgi:tripartite-type tricarboxylate transporter receptor subunit TctC